jgi:molybdenum cofactor cytidylyltransferase
MTPPDLQMVLLAAGSSTRFGSPKLLADVHGQPMLATAIDTLLALGHSDSIVVVIGAHAVELEPLVREAAVKSVFNAEFEQGMSSSIRTGLSAVRPDCRGVLIALADQVAVTSADLRQLVARWQELPDRIAAARYAHVTGVPAIFPAALFDELAALQGDSGARKLLKRFAEQVVTVHMPSAAVDVDTPADLAIALECIGRRQDPESCLD